MGIVENMQTKPAAFTEDEVEFVPVCARTPSGIEFPVYMPRSHAVQAVDFGAFTFVLCEPEPRPEPEEEEAA